jgi:pyruvate/2-oxoacid:ferredoxin oxidoreductase alpha subunit
MRGVDEASMAIAKAVKLAKPDVVPMYPITPQTHIVERIADFINDGELKAEMIHLESEHSAMAASIGASAAGSRVFTATCSQGLALMHEMLHIASGMRMPIVMAVANRALSAPINIWCFSKDAKVLMKDLSYKPINEIKIGDEVLGKDKKGNLKFTRVMRTFRRTADKLVKLKMKGFELVCTPEHRFYHHPTHSHWVKAENLKNKELHWFGYGFDENKEFKRGWLAGMSDGDGCFFRDKENRFSFKLKVKDAELVNTFIKWSEEFGFAVRETDCNKKRGFFTAILTRNKETERLQKFLEKSKDNDFYRGYLAGIYDAEGSGPFKVKQAVIYNSNKSLVEFISKILRELKISFKVYSDNRRGRYYTRDNYHIKINNVPEFFVKCRPVLERKRENILRMTIKSVKSRLEILDVVKINEKTEVYNLETETNNYIVNGLLAHNCDHQDSISQRDTGWIQLYVESTQEAFDTTLQAFKIAENKNVALPVMVCLDGFQLSHVYEPADILSQEEVDSFLPKFEPEYRLDPNNAATFGPIAYPNVYMEIKKEEQDAILNSLKTIKEVHSEFAKKFGRKYGNGLLECYKCNDAKQIVVAMGTVAGTARVVIDKLRKEGRKVGLVKLKCFRPFPEDEIIKALGKADEVAVLDRAVSYGLKLGPVCADIRNVLKCGKPVIKSYIVGLGGRDVTEQKIEYALNNINKKEVEWLL